MFGRRKIAGFAIVEHAKFAIVNKFSIIVHAVFAVLDSTLALVIIEHAAIAVLNSTLAIVDTFSVVGITLAFDEFNTLFHDT